VVEEANNRPTTSRDFDSSRLRRDRSSLYRDGWRLHRDRSSLYRDGWRLHRDRSSLYRDGWRLHRDGSGWHRDRSRSHRDRSRSHRDGSRLHRDGWRLHRDTRSLQRDRSSLDCGCIPETSGSQRLRWRAIFHLARFLPLASSTYIALFAFRWRAPVLIRPITFFCNNFVTDFVLRSQ
jgi:hypothetical protein